MTSYLGSDTPPRWSMAEFFAGSGAVRIGFGPRWRCVFANENEPWKVGVYRLNFGGDELNVRGVERLTTADLPLGLIDLAWSSFPCRDISSAGPRVGLDGRRSHLFWDFWALVQGLAAEGRPFRLVVLENVERLATSNGGRDLALIRDAYERGGYGHGTALIDAQCFVPQSRVRVFVVGAYERPSSEVQGLIDAALKTLPRRTVTLEDVLDLDAPPGQWEFPHDEVSRTLAMLSPSQREEFDRMRALSRATGRPVAIPFSRRMRGPKSGEREQRMEIRTDGLAYALRFAKTGGSSKQFLVIVNGDTIRMRAILPREAARLTGFPAGYVLPGKATDALSLCGDAVVVGVARWLAANVLEPLRERNT
jgi:DNA (cytosine-5)-methyltransferase 1